jgi:hypothetical protein
MVQDFRQKNAIARCLIGPWSEPSTTTSEQQEVLELASFGAGVSKIEAGLKFEHAGLGR